jgi:hypothetical protein
LTAQYIPGSVSDDGNVGFPIAVIIGGRKFIAVLSEWIPVNPLLD